MALINLNENPPSDKIRGARASLNRSSAFMGELKRDRHADLIIRKRGYMFIVFNNQAQLSNIGGDLQQSVNYLKRALDVSKDPETNRDLLPLTETYLNLANSTSYIGQRSEADFFGKEALKRADVRIKKIQAEMDKFKRRPQAKQDPAEMKNLDTQFHEYIQLKIMTLMFLGEEKLRDQAFQIAFKHFEQGKSLAEYHFGHKSQLYVKCANFIGETRLKSKYQTKENYREVKGSGLKEASEKPARVTSVKRTRLSSATRRKPATEKKQKRRSSSGEKELLNIEVPSSVIKQHLPSVKMRKVNANTWAPKNSDSSRRDIAKIIRERQSQLGPRKRSKSKDSIIIANAETWSIHKNHPHLPMGSSRAGLSQGHRSTISRIMTKKMSRRRPASAKMEGHASVKVARASKFNPFDTAHHDPQATINSQPAILPEVAGSRSQTELQASMTE